MSIQRKASGFYELDADPRFQQPHSVGVESGRVDACLARYNEAGMGGLFGNPEFGFHEDNLDFLHAAQVKPVYLWFWDVNLKNVDALYALEEVDYFGINPKRPGIDFARFRRMTTVFNHWVKADTGLARANISKYHLWHFNPRSQSFAKAELPLAVQQLHLVWNNPPSLAGLPVMEQLTELQIHRNRNLADLSLLPRIAPHLRRLLVTTCPRLVPTAGVLDHPTLESALIAGKELLAQGGG